MVEKIHYIFFEDQEGGMLEHHFTKIEDLPAIGMNFRIELNVETSKQVHYLKQVERDWEVESQGRGILLALLTTMKLGDVLYTSNGMLVRVVKQVHRGCVEKGHDHELKTWPIPFQSVLDGVKHHEVRKTDDRDFAVGQILLLREYDHDKKSYTGRDLTVEVTYMSSPSTWGLPENVAVLSIQQTP